MIKDEVYIAFKMRNPVIELLKKIGFKKRSRILNEMTNSYDDVLYDQINQYEWVENVRNRQEEFVNRNYTFEEQAVRKQIDEFK